MMNVTTDLVYVIDGKEAFVSCVVTEDDKQVEIIGPFEAKLAANEIIDKLHSRYYFVPRQHFVDWYVIQHFANMSAGKNALGNDYPTYVKGDGE